MWTVSFSQIGLSPLSFRSNHPKGRGGVGGESYCSPWEFLGGWGFCQQALQSMTLHQMNSCYFPHLFLAKLSSSEIFWLFLLPEKSILISDERKNTVIPLCALINLMWGLKSQRKLVAARHWSLLSYERDFWLSACNTVLKLNVCCRTDANQLKVLSY